MDFQQKNLACKHLQNIDESFQTQMTDYSDICSYNEDDYASILGSFRVNEQTSQINNEQRSKVVKDPILDEYFLKQNRHNTLDTKLFQHTKKNTSEFEVYIEDYQCEDSDQETVEDEDEQQDTSLLKSNEKEIIEDRIRRLNQKLGSQHIMSIIIEDKNESNDVSEISKDTIQKNISFKNQWTGQSKYRRSLSDTPFFAKKQQTLKQMNQQIDILDPEKVFIKQNSQQNQSKELSANLSPTQLKDADQIKVAEEFFKQICQQYIMHHNLSLMNKMNRILENQNFTDPNETHLLIEQILKQKISKEFVQHLLKLKTSDKRNAAIKIQRFYKKILFKKIVMKIIEGKRQLKLAKRKFFQLNNIQQQI